MFPGSASWWKTISKVKVVGYSFAKVTCPQASLASSPIKVLLRNTVANVSSVFKGSWTEAAAFLLHNCQRWIITMFSWMQLRNVWRMETLPSCWDRGAYFNFRANGAGSLPARHSSPWYAWQSVSVCFSPCKIINKSYQENFRRGKDTVALGYSYPLDLLASSFPMLMEILSGILPLQSTACTDLDHAEFKPV